MSYRTLATFAVGNKEISTVSLANNLYETRIFPKGSARTEYQAEYHSEADAMLGHQSVVNLLIERSHLNA